MLFNSIEFLIFLPIVFFLYWFVFKNNLKLQNLLLFFSGYVFYGFWDWRFVFLLLLSTLIDYSFGLLIDKTEGGKKKAYLWLSIFNNLAVLGIFKYYNFFAESTQILFEKLGFTLHPYMLTIALPVGISFYTFHGMSYVFDIYRGKTKPEKNFIDYSVFVSFFPLLVAGPIERATHLLPQIVKPRKFDYESAIDGLRQILWGVFKKMVIADNCAVFVNDIFGHHNEYSSLTLAFGAVLFSFQIYADFSGYSDMALGVAKLFGFTLLRNFSYPYFSRDIAEFWRRWHISLSSWFKDYLYIPLGGSSGPKWMKIRNTFIIFIVSGFWHGANWTYIIWGALNAVYFLPLLLLKQNRKNLDLVAQNRYFPTIRELGQIFATFLLVTVSWVFFRAETISKALEFLQNIVIYNSPRLNFTYPRQIIAFILIMLAGEWFQRDKYHPLDFRGIKIRPVIRWVIYYLLITFIICFSAKQQQFIYFQF